MPEEQVENMSDKQLNKEAYKQATDEIQEEDILRIKGYVKQILKTIDEKKKAKENIEEQLRILKADLEDLKEGKTDKIEERIQKSPVARRLSASTYNGMYKPFSTLPRHYTLIEWQNVTAGTYNTGYRIYYL